MKDVEVYTVEFEEALLQIDRLKAKEIFDRAYQSEQSFGVLESLAIGSLEKVGQGWEEGTISLSQVYMSGVICEELVDEYLPKLEEKRNDIPTMAIAVLRDYHALGKRIVYSVLRAGGFEILDFGHGLSVDELVQKTIDHKVEVLLISTLMLPSALKVKAVKEKLLAEGASVRIIVGGAPFRLDDTLWRSVGADADGKGASSIVSTIDKLLKGDRAI